MRRDSRGVAAIEFALIAPVFFMITLGIIVYGVYFTTWIAVTQIASESARAALGGLTTAEQTSLATTRYTTMIGYYAPLLTSSSASISFPTASSGSVAVQVTYDFTSFGFSAFTLLPVPTTKPSVTVTVSSGSP